MLYVSTLAEAIGLVCSIGEPLPVGSRKRRRRKRQYCKRRRRNSSAGGIRRIRDDRSVRGNGARGIRVRYRAAGRRTRIDAALLDALGGLLAEPLISPTDVPPFDRSQVDGFAVYAADTFGASESLPALLACTGEVLMGQDAGPALLRGSCRAVPTGGQLPDGADAVIMIEDVEDHGDGFRYLNRSVSPGAHVLYRGDDVRTGQTLLPAGARLMPQDLAAAAALGLTRLRVLKASPVPVRSGLTVGILSTGDELAPAGRPLAAGQVYDINAAMLAALLRHAGFASRSYGILPDQCGQITGALQSALADCQAVVITGGSSVGDRDHVAAAIAASGSPGVLLHGIAVKPGKPTLIGLCGDVPVLGLPGHPLAAWFMARQLLLPLLYRMAGLAAPGEPVIRARLIRQVPSCSRPGGTAAGPNQPGGPDFAVRAGERPAAGDRLASRTGDGKIRPDHLVMPCPGLYQNTARLRRPAG